MGEAGDTEAGGEHMMINEAELISPRSPVQVEEGVSYYRASMVGVHEHILVDARLGYDPQYPSDKAEGWFAEGNQVEKEVLDVLRAPMRSTVEREQEEVIVPISKTVAIRGHIDAVIDGYVTEIKGLGESTYKLFKSKGLDAFPRYATQLSIYMWGTQLPGRMIVRPRAGYMPDIRDRGIHQIEKGYLGTPVDVGQIKKKIMNIEMKARRGERVPTAGCDMYPCPYSYLHDPDESWEQVDDAQLEFVAGRYIQLGADIKELEEQRKVLRDQIEAGIGGRDKVKSGLFSMQWVKQNKTTLDKEKLAGHLEQAGLTIDEFNTTAEFRQLRVRRG